MARPRNRPAGRNFDHPGEARRGRSEAALADENRHAEPVLCRAAVALVGLVALTGCDAAASRADGAAVTGSPATSAADANADAATSAPDLPPGRPSGSASHPVEAPPPAPSPPPWAVPRTGACPPDDGRPISLMHHVHSGDAARVNLILERYRCRYPDRTSLVTIGESHGGLPLLALYLGSSMPAPALAHDRPTVLLHGGIHGAEVMSTLFVFDAIAGLLESDDPDVAAILEQLVVVAVPLLNPDGNHLSANHKLVGRKNGRDLNGDGRRAMAEGVDLNRNFPFRWGSLGERGSSRHPISQYYRGPAAASEPETRALMRLAHHEHFVGALAYHTGTIALLVPYAVDGAKSPTPDLAWAVAEDIAARAHGHPEGRFPVRRRLYPVDGSDIDWLRHQLGTVALLVEGADDGGRPQPLRLAMRRAVATTWRVLLERFVKGPAVTGRVLDAAGRPVAAELQIDEIVLHEGERWTSRCRDGRYARYLPREGRYTVRVRPPGGEEVVVALEAKGLTHHDISLPLALPTTTSPCVEPVFPDE